MIDPRGFIYALMTAAVVAMGANLIIRVGLSVAEEMRWELAQ
ncbi:MULTISPECIES: hypothetical protein [unclassified Methylocystis]|nr:MULTISPECIES: hypothetical protein [unclassified Methylocystis]